MPFSQHFLLLAKVSDSWPQDKKKGSHGRAPAADTRASLRTLGPYLLVCDWLLRVLSGSSPCVQVALETRDPVFPYHSYRSVWRGLLLGNQNNQLWWARHPINNVNINSVYVHITSDSSYSGNNLNSVQRNGLSHQRSTCLVWITCLGITLLRYGGKTSELTMTTGLHIDSVWTQGFNLTVWILYLLLLSGSGSKETSKLGVSGGMPSILKRLRKEHLVWGEDTLKLLKWAVNTHFFGMYFQSFF